MISTKKVADFPTPCVLGTGDPPEFASRTLPLSGYLQDISAKAAAIRFSISCGDTSSLCVAIDQL